MAIRFRRSLAAAALTLSLGGCDDGAASRTAHAQAPGALAATEIPAPPPITPPVETEPFARFLGQDETAQRRSLATEAVAEIERGRGGRSLAFKLTLADGTEGYFKPEQSFSAAHWYSEVAAYYLDRELGFGRVPPIVGRRLDWAPLRAVARRDERVSEVVVADDGTVRGAFVWWVTGGLDVLQLGRGWERWVRAQPGLAFTPYQRVRAYRAEVNGHPLEPEEAENQRRAGEPDTEDRAAELSDMIVFDFLTSNVDRWGGGFTNVRTRGDGGSLVFLDNGAGFWLGRNRLWVMDRRLDTLQRFRRSTVEALQAFDIERYERRLATDALAPILNERQLAGVEERRLAVLEHVTEMERRFGAEAIPW